VEACFPCIITKSLNPCKWLGLFVIAHLEYRMLVTDSVQIISTKEARKLLGKEAEEWTDEEVANFVMVLDQLAQCCIKREVKVMDRIMGV
jgi:hypothetical protein